MTSMTHSLSVISEDITTNHTLQKTRFFGLQSVADSMGLTQLLWRNWPQSCRIRSHSVISGNNRKPVCVDIVDVLHCSVWLSPKPSPAKTWSKG